MGDECSADATFEFAVLAKVAYFSVPPSMFKRSDIGPRFRFMVPKRSIGKGFTWIRNVLVCLQNENPGGHWFWYFEHIEHFLHPKLSADFMQDICGSTPFAVFETHEEALLMRARRLVAEKQIPSENVIILRFTSGKVERFPVKDDGSMKMAFPDGYAEFFWEMSTEIEEAGDREEGDPDHDDD
jgi:hypothetical protein